MRVVLIIALLGSVLTPDIAAAEPRFGQFRLWAAGCDNARDCRVMGFGGEESEGALVIDRRAAADAEPSLCSFGRLSNMRVDDGTTVELTADGVGLAQAVVGSGLSARDDERRSFEGEARQDILTNPAFNEPTITLTDFTKSRGLGDCGSMGPWCWDGWGFRLLQYDYMPRCEGLTPGEWLTLHRSQ